MPGAVGLLGVDAQRDRRWLSSGVDASHGDITALEAIKPSWGLPILLVFSRSLNQYTIGSPLTGMSVSLIGLH